MVNYGIYYTLAQVGATSWSRPYGDHISIPSRPGGHSYQRKE